MEKRGVHNILWPLMTDAVNIAARRLQEAGIDNAANEARWLCEGAGEALFAERVKRRIKGEPLQYILGTVPFHCVELYVGPGVLIPRPETEQLVEIALSLPRPSGPICDLCTGSGAIALAMAHALKDVRFTGIDLSCEALEWAERNRTALSLENVSFLQGDLYGPLQEDDKFAMITANPPYVSPDEYSRLDSVVKDYEPRLALEAGEDGLQAIRRIIEGASRHLLPGGAIIMEIGDKQGAAVKELFSRSGIDAEIRRDYAGKERFAVAITGE